MAHAPALAVVGQRAPDGQRRGVALVDDAVLPRQLPDSVREDGHPLAELRRRQVDGPRTAPVAGSVARSCEAPCCPVPSQSVRPSAESSNPSVYAAGSCGSVARTWTRSRATPGGGEASAPVGGGVVDGDKEHPPRAAPSAAALPSPARGEDSHARGSRGRRASSAPRTVPPTAEPEHPAPELRTPRTAAPDRPGLRDPRRATGPPSSGTIGSVYDLADATTGPDLRGDAPEERPVPPRLSAAVDLARAAAVEAADGEAGPGRRGPRGARRGRRGRRPGQRGHPLLRRRQARLPRLDVGRHGHGRRGRPGRPGHPRRGGAAARHRRRRRARVDPVERAGPRRGPRPRRPAARRARRRPARPGPREPGRRPRPRRTSPRRTSSSSARSPTSSPSGVPA